MQSRKRNNNDATEHASSRRMLTEEDFLHPKNIVHHDLSKPKIPAHARRARSKKTDIDLLAERLELLHISSDDYSTSDDEGSRTSSRMHLS